LHFLLGYSTRAADRRAGNSPSPASSAWCSPAVHLNQEVRIATPDLANGLRTNAVVFGARRTLMASLVVFTAAYSELAVLAALGVLPRVVA
jgi:4-hydroxybenzoate polyprenyltransferase